MIKIKLRKENDFWGLMHPDEVTNKPPVMLSHLNPEVTLDEAELPEWAMEVIDKSVSYGILIVTRENSKDLAEPVILDEKKEQEDETVVKSNGEKIKKAKKAPGKTTPKKAVIVS